VQLDDTEHLIAASGSHVSSLGSAPAQQPPSPGASKPRKLPRT